MVSGARWGGAVYAVLVLGQACASSGDPYGTVSGTGRRGASSSGQAASNGAASSGSGGASTSSMSTSTGSSASTGSSGQSCGAPPTELNDCDAGQVELRASMSNFCLGGSAVDQVIEGTDYNDPDIILSTDACGDVYFCVAPDTQVAMSFTVQGFWPTIYENILLQSSFDFPQAPLFCDQATMTALEEVEVDPPIDVNKPLVDVVVIPDDTDSACPRDGWTFVLENLDGGVVDAGGVVYFTGSTVQPGTQTTLDGIALYYNVDATAGIVHVVGTHNGATSCAVSYADYQLSASVPIANSDISFYPFPLNQP